MKKHTGANNIQKVVRNCPLHTDGTGINTNYYNRSANLCSLLKEIAKYVNMSQVIGVTI